MKKKHSILYSFTALLICSLLPGCGCGAVQTTAYPETVSVEESLPVSEPEEEPSSVPEATEAEETTSSQASETEETAPLEETVSIEELKIIEMDVVMYATANVNIREEPSTDAEKIGSLSVGKEIHITGVTEDDQWFRVEEGDTVGFISSGYLDLEKPVEKSESTSQQTEQNQSSEQTQSSETPSTPESDPTETPDGELNPNPAPAPNPGAQGVYDQVQQNQNNPTPPAGSIEENNQNLFGNIDTDSNFIGNGGAGGILHAAD